MERYKLVEEQKDWRKRWSIRRSALDVADSRTKSRKPVTGCIDAVYSDESMDLTEAGSEELGQDGRADVRE